MRTCTTCKKTKDLECFNKRKERPRAGGYTRQCKDCINEKRRETREKNREHYRQKSAEWRENNRERWNEIHRNRRKYTPEERKALYAKPEKPLANETDPLYEKKAKKWKKINWAEHTDIKRLSHKENHNSRVYLRKAVEQGKVKRKDKCEICKIDKSYEAHHHDYSKPYEVLWLCRTCHYELHTQERLRRENGTDKRSQKIVQQNCRP